jgi:hypothetical protein
MTINASGSLTLTEINTEFALGKSMGVHRGVTWFLENGSTGTFASTNLKFSDFYSKKKLSPVSPSSTTYTPGTYSFTVPYYNTLVIKAWGAGGGGGGNDGDNTVITYGTITLTSGGGKGGGAGGASGATGPGGIGGTATGGDINDPGLSGGVGATNSGGNAGGQADGGGTGGTANSSPPCGVSVGNSGSVPGGGGAGNIGRDCSKYGGMGYAGGGGGGGFVKKTHVSGGVNSPSHAQIISITVGAGHSGAEGAAGANGQVTISWS